MNINGEVLNPPAVVQHCLYIGFYTFCINEMITGSSVSNKHILNTKFYLPAMNLQMHKSTCNYIFLATEK